MLPKSREKKAQNIAVAMAVYLAETVDALVLEVVHKMFESIKDNPYSKTAEQRIRSMSASQKSKKVAAEKRMKAAQTALEKFEGEILKCLMGTSNFSEEMIAKQIRLTEQELDAAKADFARIQSESISEADEIRKLRNYYNEFCSWAEEFDTAPIEIKRTILSKLIDKVELGRGYQVSIRLNVNYEQFMAGREETVA